MINGGCRKKNGGEIAEVSLETVPFGARPFRLVSIPFYLVWRLGELMEGL